MRLAARLALIRLVFQGSWSVKSLFPLVVQQFIPLLDRAVRSQVFEDGGDNEGVIQDGVFLL